MAAAAATAAEAEMQTAGKSTTFIPFCPLAIHNYRKESREHSDAVAVAAASNKSDCRQSEN